MTNKAKTGNALSAFVRLVPCCPPHSPRPIGQDLRNSTLRNILQRPPPFLLSDARSCQARTRHQRVSVVQPVICQVSTAREHPNPPSGENPSFGTVRQVWEEE